MLKDRIYYTIAAGGVCGFGIDNFYGQHRSRDW